jgi:hypothetical protein
VSPQRVLSRVVGEVPNVDARAHARSAPP